MKVKYIKTLILLVLIVVFEGCATIPPEFYTAMEKEKDGVMLLEKRHRQTVNELAEVWYNERLKFLSYIKQIEVSKITIHVDDPDGGGKIEALKKEQLDKIEKQFSEAEALALKIKDQLILGYSDSENWNKLLQLHAINLEMTQSLTELNASQRKFYGQLVGENVPFPSDFINEETKNILIKN